MGRDTIEYKGVVLNRMIKNMNFFVQTTQTFYDRFNNKQVENETKDFSDLMKVLETDDHFEAYTELISYYGYLVGIQLEKKTKSKPYDPVNTELHDNINNHSIFFKYIDYDINKNAKTFSELVKTENEQVKNSCYVNIIYDAYKDTITHRIKQNSRKNHDNETKTFTIDKLCELCNIQYKTDSIGLSLRKSLKFFEYYRLGLKAINFFGDYVMPPYEPEKYNSHISPRTLYILVHNDH